MDPLQQTSRYSGSIPYDNDDQGVTLYPIWGKHSYLDVENAIYWCHNNLDLDWWTMKVHAVWILGETEPT